MDTSRVDGVKAPPHDGTPRHTEKKPVTLYTVTSSIFLVSPSGNETIHIAMMQNKLNAAEPTIVLGPRSPVKKSLVRISMTLSSISGAEEPRAIKVKFATVAFHTLYVISVPGTRFSFDVIVSMDAINISAIIDTPRKNHNSPNK